MDIIAILRQKISLLDLGEHSTGLEATLSHVETAFRHLKRGQKDEDQTAFTDAIYRTNQAFEGAIKEAYRVLTKKSPENVRPYDIESYFSKSGVFRPRVLDQFTNYRTEWRNPSTHDYKLYFNESEAFLAIVSVTAFCCLLLDEIAQQLAHDKEVAAVQQIIDIVKNDDDLINGDLLTRAVEALKLYFLRHSNEQFQKSTGYQWLGSVSGFLSALIPDAKITTEASLGVGKIQVTADLILECGTEKVIIEIKNRLNLLTYKNIIKKVDNLMQSSGVSGGVIFFLPTELKSEAIYEADNILFSGAGRLRIISPFPLLKDTAFEHRSDN